MKRNIKIISIIIFSLLLLSCGFKTIKQSGAVIDIRNIKSSVDRALAKLTPKELEAYEMGISDRNNKIFDSMNERVKNPVKRKKGEGKLYASMNKKYGGGIYPRKPTNG